MGRSIPAGFIAGALGAFILVIIFYILKWTGMGGEPGFVSLYRSAFVATPKPPGDEIIAAFLFLISGGFWGIVYVLLVKQSTVIKGFLFGLLPTLWMLIVVPLVMDAPLFNGFTAKGILMPLIFNMVIWGSFIGWYLSRKK